MHFEHLIPIDDPDASPARPLTRAQIWAGLLLRVEDPLPFLPGLESCTVVARNDREVRRQLDFGGAMIEDRVTREDGLWLRFDIDPGKDHAGGSLTIRIEEPQPEIFFLRFTYATGLPESSSAEGSACADVIRSAYHQSDLDTVRIIRELADARR